MSSNLTLVSACVPPEQHEITANARIQLEASIDVHSSLLHPMIYSLNNEHQLSASQAAHQQLFDFPASSMHRQQTEHINNLASIGFYDMQGGINYLDKNRKSEVISSACGHGGGDWLPNANSKAAYYNYTGGRLELGSAAEEMFCKESMDTGAVTHDLPPDEQRGNNGINSEDYLGLISTESSHISDFLSSGNAVRASNDVSLLDFLHGAQSMANVQQLDNDVACRNPNLPLPAQYWENGHSKVNSNYTAVNAAGCSSNRQEYALTLFNINQRSHDYPSSRQKLQGISLNYRHHNNDAADQHMRQSSRYSSLDHPSYPCRGAYSSVGVLRTSMYLRAVQQLLEEVCNVKSTCYGRRSCCVKGDPHSASAGSSGAHDVAGVMHPKTSPDDEPLRESRQAGRPISACRKQLLQQSAMRSSGEERCHLQMRKARLIGMVEELDRGYQKYREQMQLIVTSFESATGMDAAAPYTALAKKLISRQFRALRDAIGQHIHDACRMLGEDISSVPVLNKGETPRLRFLDQRLRHHRTLQQVGMLSQHLQAWRPQRGLPERSVAVLRAWLFEHFLHPYPKDSQKLMLARLTGLTRNQVANWFINARVRLWKPMVEQLYAEDKKEAQFQNRAGLDRLQNEETSNIIEYGSCDYPNGNNDMALAIHEKPLKRHRYQHFEHEDCNSSRTLHSSIMTKDGVCLTLALDEHSTLDKLAHYNIYKPNRHYVLHPLSGDSDYNITNVFS